MPVVTISRFLGTTGDAIAEGVARALGARLVNRQSLITAATAAGVSPECLAEIHYESTLSLTNVVLNMLRQLPAVPRSRGSSILDAAPLPTAAGNRTGVAPSVAEMEQGVHLLEKVMRDLAAEGNVVMVGRGANLVLKDTPDAFHVQVVATVEARIQHLMRVAHVDRREALARLWASDRARTDHIRRYYNQSWTDSTLYDMVLNSERIETGQAIQLIVAAARARARRAEAPPIN
ncbi:MAG: cytidylate kinase-like family protein [Anaerolineae bacterium]